MKWFKKFIGVVALGVSLAASGQSAVIRGEIVPGTYQSFKTDANGNVYTVPGTGSGGNVTTYTQAAVTVTNSSGTLVAANSSRSYLQVQNRDATGNIYVVCSGGAATVATGVKIGPGQTWAPYNPPGVSCTAIGDIASNANVNVVQG